MKAAFALVLLALVACKKEEVRTDVRYEVTCRECAVEYKDGDGAFHRDTVLWLIDYHHEVDTFPFSVIDTMPLTTAWNVAIEEGASPFISACSLRDASFNDPVSVRITGTTLADSHTSGCAIIAQ